MSLFTQSVWPHLSSTDSKFMNHKKKCKITVLAECSNGAGPAVTCTGLLVAGPSLLTGRTG